MTATRPWVKWGARWLARLQAASPLIRMGSLVLTGTSTALLALKQFGYGEMARPFLAVVAVSGLVFTYYYTEGGVYNQQQRDKREFGFNFAAPNHRIDDEMIGRAVAAGISGKELGESEREAVAAELDKAYTELRDGIQIEENQ